MTLVQFYTPKGLQAMQKQAAVLKRMAELGGDSEILSAVTATEKAINRAAILKAGEMVRARNKKTAKAEEGLK